MTPREEIHLSEKGKIVMEERRYVTKVKLFQATTVVKLERAINNFLAEHYWLEIVDIKLSVSEMFESALIIYRER